MTEHKKTDATKEERKKKPQAKSRWTPINKEAVEKITAGSTSPGFVFPLPVADLPASIQPMPGVVSYYVSSYTAAISIGSGLSAGGELAVVRTDGNLNKAYNYIFASSSDGNVYFNGPYKDFAEHHSPKRKPVIYFTIFGNTPFTE